MRLAWTCIAAAVTKLSDLHSITTAHANDEIAKLHRSVKDIQLRLGPVVEAISRERVSKVFGTSRANSVGISNLAQLMEYAGSRMTVTDQQIHTATERLLEHLVGSFEGYDAELTLSSAFNGLENN